MNMALDPAHNALGELTDKVKYLEDKMKQLINERIQEKMKERQASAP